MTTQLLQQQHTLTQMTIVLKFQNLTQKLRESINFLTNTPLKN